MNLIIDEGNTRIKLAVFNNKKLIDFMFSDVKNCKNIIEKILSEYVIKAVIISSVTDEMIEIVNGLKVDINVLLTKDTSFPFKNLYQTPNTLGVDRMVLVAGVWNQFPNQNSLIIDIGTCITYDFINYNGEYLGGAISPGLGIRFKSMNVFTQKLPKLEVPKKHVDIIGKTTKKSMESGVLNGVFFEIEGFINSYKQRFKTVNVILTGGDAELLEEKIKKNIFVDPLFLLKGLNTILMYQEIYKD